MKIFQKANPVLNN